MADGAIAYRFTYHRAVAPMMWVLVVLATIELLVVHLLVSFWNPAAALVLSVVTAGSVAWLVGVIASMRRLPVLLDRTRLVMRVGTLHRVDIPLSRIAGLRASWDAGAVKQRSVRNMALVAYPNIVVDLAAPLPGRRGIVAVAHRLDDPAGFAAALDRLRAKA